MFSPKLDNLEACDSEKIIQLLLNNDYTHPKWSVADIEQAKKFADSDFRQGLFVHTKKKTNTIFHEKTGVYKLGPSVIPRRSPGTFFDPRIHGFREVLDDVKYRQNGFLHFGHDKEGRFPSQGFSITIVCKGRDIPKRFFLLWKQFVRDTGKKAASALERGERNNHLHIQGLYETPCSLDNDAPKEIIAAIKAALNVVKDDNMSICVKRITNGSEGILRVMAYVQKDEGKVHYVLDNFGYSTTELAEAKQHYIAESGALLSFSVSSSCIPLHNIYNLVHSRRSI